MHLLLISIELLVVAIIVDMLYVNKIIKILIYSLKFSSLDNTKQNPKSKLDVEFH